MQRFCSKEIQQFIHSYNNNANKNKIVTFIEKLLSVNQNCLHYWTRRAIVSAFLSGSAYLQITYCQAGAQRQLAIGWVTQPPSERPQSQVNLTAEPSPNQQGEPLV